MGDFTNAVKARGFLTHLSCMPWERIQEQEAETDLVTGTEARNERTKKTDTEKFKQYFLDGMAHESFLGTKPIPKCSDHISLTHLADTPPTTIT